MPFFSKSAPSDKQFDKKYKKEVLLGTGNFAKVHRVTLKDGSDPTAYAAKIIDKSKVEDMKDLERETEIMSSIDHPYILKLYHIFDSAKTMVLIIELAEGGELFDRIVERGSYTENDAAVVMKQLCEALKHLHDQQIVHRDLKPENILLATKATDSNIKLADFGLARVVSNKDMMKTACGTPGYVAPEILQNKGYDSGAVDMWSAGVILYILLCGFPPFYEEELPALFEQIQKGRYDFPSPWWDAVSKEAIELIRLMLTVEPKKRIDAGQAIAHPWVQGKAPSTSLAGSQQQLKKYQAALRLKKAGRKIIAMQKFAMLAKEESAA